MVHLTPGDPAIALLGDHANKTSVEKLRKEMGLDKPLYEQYIIFAKKAVVGDFGYSTKTKQPVLSEFKDRFPATAELALVAMLLAVILGISAGIISAIKRYSIFDYSAMFAALAGVSMPVFWLGLVMIYFFSVTSVSEAPEGSLITHTLPMSGISCGAEVILPPSWSICPAQASTSSTATYGSQREWEVSLSLARPSMPPIT